MAVSVSGQQSACALPLTSNHTSGFPEGACNFRELGRSTRSPVCGCKRFWLDANNVLSQPGVATPAWCFCGHHACFHNAVSQNTQRLISQQPSLSSRLDGATSLPVAGGTDSISRAIATAGLGIQPDTSLRCQSQSINTRVWDALNAFARGQDDCEADVLHLPSTVASIDGGVTAPRPMGPPIYIPTLALPRPGGDDYQGSATEIATPSIAGTPDLTAYIPPTSQNRQSPCPSLAVLKSPLTPVGAQCAPQSRQPTSPAPMTAIAQQIKNTDYPPVTSQQLLTMLRTHAERLAALESASFSQGPMDEVQDRLELLDGRLLDLEQWRVEVEQRVTREGEVAAGHLPKDRKRRLLPAEAPSFVTEESFDMVAAVHAEAKVLATIATRVGFAPRIEDLESRVAGLERSKLPTYAHPWTVQVVLLPWGRDLKGAWFSADDATQHSMRTTASQADEWTGAQPQSKPSFGSSSSSSRAWTTESIEAWAQDTQDWLSGKACGPSSTVFQRLASRGFVRAVTLSQPDARHILDTLASSFKDVLYSAKLKQMDASATCMALQQSVIPLRKVRKSSRLRFLDQAEMLTPAIWNAQFLDSSVFMKTGDGQRRLYITTPHSYVQRGCDELSWHKIRQMPATDMDGEIQAAQVDDSAAIEACWSYNDKLDYAASLNSSFASHRSHNSAWSIKSQPPSEQSINIGPLTPALSGMGSQQAHKRTMSSPESASDKQQDSMTKRRVASFDTIDKIAVGVVKDGHKRPRLSGSQDVTRRGVLFTPRDSNEPVSPLQSELDGKPQEQSVHHVRKRSSTQNFYATPYSIDHLEIDGDGDTERDSADQDSANESEWDGMDLAGHIVDEELISDVDQSFDSDGDDHSSYEEDEDMN